MHRKDTDISILALSDPPSLKDRYDKDKCRTFPPYVQNLSKSEDMNPWINRSDQVSEKQNNGGSILSRQTKHYAAETSIHGIKYIMDDKRHYSERYPYQLFAHTFTCNVIVYITISYLTW